MSNYYQVEYRRGDHWQPGMVITMRPAHLSPYLSILARRRVDTRLRRTDAHPHYHFNGTQLKALT